MTAIPTRPFGPLQTPVSAIGQGTWMLEQAPAAQAIASLQAGIDLGLTHIDTAEMYGNGAAERLVAQAIAGRRASVFLVSKVLPGNASRAGTLKACEASLRRLGTDYLDCYLLHWRGNHPLAATFEAMALLQQQGKIRTFGVSNFDVEDLDEALALLGPGQLACNQVLYHANERAIEHAVLPWCQRQQAALVGYSPFGHDGFPAASSGGGKLLAELAATYGVQPRQIVLAFLLRQHGVFLIPKAATRAHVEANATAGTLMLNADDLKRLDAAFPRGRKPNYLPMI